MKPETRCEENTCLVAPLKRSIRTRFSTLSRERGGSGGGRKKRGHVADSVSDQIQRRERMTSSGVYTYNIYRYIHIIFFPTEGKEDKARANEIKKK